ncbi:hypothetical protein EBQ81_00655 [bacterium]|nr:hypothetical protein [bacterium]
MSLNNMFEETKELAEMKAFSEAQQKTIIQLTKKIKQLEEERDHLKKLVESNVPLVTTDEKQSYPAEKFLTSDQEAICRTQLLKLREMALDRELTLEETKKVEIFSKILVALENAPKVIKVNTDKLNNDDLLSLVSSEVETNE